MGHLFISYSHKDKAYAHKLQRYLLEKGFEAWIDDRIDLGARWPHEIEKRVRECDAFILVMSPNSRDSEWVQNELMLARDLKKRIFPLLLEGEAWWHLRTTQYVNVQGGKLPPASFLLSLADAAPRGVSREVPAPAEKTGAGGMPNINFYGDVSGNVIIGDSNQIKPAKPGRGALVQPDKLPQTPKIKPEIVIALIGLVGTIITALCAWAASPTFLAMMARTPAPTLTAALAPVLTSNVPETKPLATQTLDLPINPFFSQSSTSLPIGIPDLTATPTFPRVPTSFATETPGIKTEIIDAKGVTMRLVAAGTFTMGSDAYYDEKPIHTVKLPDYYMDVYEVTNTLYKACVDSGGCAAPHDTHSYNDSKYANHPVVYVDWTQAKIYCEWRAARLPTEAEWEKAARGADGRTYPWGNNMPDKTLLNYNGSEVSDTTDVGAYPTGKSPHGMYDMAGNVWEWVADWYSETYYYDTLGENAFGPQGPTSGTYRVLRGGSWGDNDYSIRSADRVMYGPDGWYNVFGFRCALSSP